MAELWHLLCWKDGVGGHFDSSRYFRFSDFLIWRFILHLQIKFHQKRFINGRVLTFFVVAKMASSAILFRRATSGFGFFNWACFCGRPNQILSKSIEKCLRYGVFCCNKDGVIGHLVSAQHFRFSDFYFGRNILYLNLKFYQNRLIIGRVIVVLVLFHL